MEDVEVDGMDVDGPDADFDQLRRQRAAQKLSKRLGKGHDAGPNQSGMSYGQAKDLMSQLKVLFIGNKITVDNAFDLDGIEALKALIFHERSAESRVKCAEGHFQAAGAGLDISMKIYSKRVDAVYNLAYKSLETKPPVAKDDDEDSAEKPREAAKGTEGAEGEDGDGEEKALGGGKGSKKRQATADVEATLLKRKGSAGDDGEASGPRQRGKEPSFDKDPFFVRTSRLIDENSPQGLLLHNLPVLRNGVIAFDASSRLEEAKAPCDVEVNRSVDLLVDLRVLPGARELLDAASRVCISPGIEDLYGMMKEQAGLPGLRVAAKVDPQELLCIALAENKRERMDAHRNAVVRQVIQQVEDAMDVDMGDTAEDEETAGGGNGDAAAADPDSDDGPGLGSGPGPDGSQLVGDDGTGAAGSPGFGAMRGGAGAGWDDDGMFSQGGAGSDREDNDRGGNRQQWASPRDEDAEEGPGGQSDDESTVLSLLSRLTGGSQGGPAAQTNNWWKSHTKRSTAASAAASKQRTRKPKPEETPLDWRGPAPEPDLEDAHMHTYKTARRDACAKLCLPPAVPGRAEDLYAFFSIAPLSSAPVAYGPGMQTAALLDSGAGCSGAGGAFDVQEAWRSILIADNLRERQLQREKRAATQAHRGAATPAGVRAGGFGGTATGSGLSGHGYDREGGLGYGSGGDYNADQDYYDEAGHTGANSPDLSDDDDDDTFDQEGDFQGARTATLEELLQPPRRVRRLPVKYDRTAGVADVATLKTNIEESLKYLVFAVDPVGSQQQADQSPGLSFQTVLDRVSVIAAKNKAPPKGASSDARTATGAGGRCGDDPLAGVSTHLAFICLLHLANEKGLALANAGNLDTLVITELGALAGQHGHALRR